MSLSAKIVPSKECEILRADQSGLRMTMEKTSLKALLRRLQSNDTGVRIQAVQALSTLPIENVLESLARALQDLEPQVRRQAVLTLASFDDYRALAPLVRSMKDPDSSVREAITQAFKDVAERGGGSGSPPESPEAWAGWLMGDMKKTSPTKGSEPPGSEAGKTFKAWAGWALSQLGESLDVENAMEGSEGGNKEPEPFKMCPYCGKSLNLPKTPRLCPYCGEGLTA